MVSEMFDVMQTNPYVRIAINGHCTQACSPEPNVDITLRRWRLFTEAHSQVQSQCSRFYTLDVAFIKHSSSIHSGRVEYSLVQCWFTWATIWRTLSVVDFSYVVPCPRLVTWHKILGWNRQAAQFPTVVAPKYWMYAFGDVDFVLSHPVTLFLFPFLLSSSSYQPYQFAPYFVPSVTLWGSSDTYCLTFNLVLDFARIIKSQYGMSISSGWHSDGFRAFARVYILQVISVTGSSTPRRAPKPSGIPSLLVLNAKR